MAHFRNPAAVEAAVNRGDAIVRVPGSAGRGMERWSMAGEDFEVPVMTDDRQRSWVARTAHGEANPPPAPPTIPATRGEFTTACAFAFDRRDEPEVERLLLALLKELANG